jgi:beta-lactamase regulating signal transducer with metallopeptidase domain
MIPSVIDLTTGSASSGLLTFLKVTCVLLIALGVTLAMRRSAAGTRHLVWFIALGSVLLLPALAAWGPVPLRVLPAPAVRTVDSISETVAAPATLGRAPGSAAVPAPPAATRALVAPAAPKRAAIGVGAVLIGVWLLGVVVLLVRLALGAWCIRRILRRARVLDRADWNGPLYEVADRLGLRQTPRLLVSDRVGIPFASGLWNPQVVLPAESEEWSAKRRSAVLVHELAHLRRRDLVAHTVSWIACALYWFHPLVWTAARRMRIESERACDDLALTLGARPSEYAEHLLDIVTSVRDRPTPAVALAMANPSEFEGRMIAILDPRLRRRGPGRLQAAALAGSLIVLALVVGVVSPARKVAAKTSARPSVAEAPGLAARDEIETRSRGLEARAARATAEAGVAAEATVAAGSAREPVEPADPVALAEHESDAHGGEPRSEESDGDRRVEVLAMTLRDDPSPEVRRVAAWGLQDHAHKSLAAEELAAALVWDEDEDVREMAAWALAESRGHASAVTALYAAFKREKSASVLRTAAWAAGSIGDASIVPGLASLLNHRDPHVREVAAWSIGSCEPHRAPAALLRLLSDENANVRLSAAWALREIGDPGSADALGAAFDRETDADVQLGMIRALGSMGDRAVETLQRLVTSPDPEIRAVAVTALAGGNATGPWPWPRPEPRPFP